MRRLIAALLLLGLAAPARAQAPIPEPHTLVRATAARIEAPAGGSAEARVVLAIAPGWHINANPPSLDYMIPTTLTLAGSGGVTPGAPVYPTPHRQKLSFEESELLVYDGEAVIRVPVRVGAGASPGIQTLRGEIGYQACNDNVCLAPVSVPFTRARVSFSAGSSSSRRSPASRLRASCSRPHWASTSARITAI